MQSAGCTVDGGVIAMIEPNLYRNPVMIPGVTYATDVHNLMVDDYFAVAFIRKLDKIKVNVTTADANQAFRVIPTQGNGIFLEVKCNDVLKVGEVVAEPISKARVSGKTADRVAEAARSYDEVRELMYLNYLVNGGASPDATDVGAQASPNTVASTIDTVLNNIIDDKAVLLKAGATPDTLLISVDTAALFEKYIGARNYWRNPSETETAALGESFSGTMFSGKVKVFTSNSLGQDNSTLVGATAATARWDWSSIEYILYDHRTLCIVNIARYLGLIEYGALIHNSTLISMLTVCGGRIRNGQKAIAKKKAAA